jgi:hypothetical protein
MAVANAIDHLRVRDTSKDFMIPSGSPIDAPARRAFDKGRHTDR